MKKSSLQAYEASKAFSYSHRRIILHVLKKSMKPITAREISNRCNLDYHAIQRRMAELRTSGLIIEDGFDSKSKFNPVKWRYVK